MLAKLRSVALNGIEAHLLQVEVDLSSGIPGVTIVGLPDAGVKEAKDRVKAAVRNSNFQFPFKKLTINLAPANIRKEGACFDLPIAMGTLLASELLESDFMQEYILVGELSLEGKLRPVQGVLSMAISAKSNGLKGIVLPYANASEASVVQGIEVIPVNSLLEAFDFFAGVREIAPYPTTSSLSPDWQDVPDFRDVIGQTHVKRAMLVAAAGGHNILMIGPPGGGKTMIAQRLPGILPPLTFEESLETTQIYSSASLLPTGSGLLGTRPFREPHHTVSDIGLIGGGARPRPGEISLANHGVLFLDELPEFQRHVLEVLRQPLEDGQVTICRAAGSVTFPAHFMLVASMNPCPCGYFGDDRHNCQCTPSQVERYVGRISGPLLDRIDLHVEVESLQAHEIQQRSSGLSSAELREKVIVAREIQTKRFCEDSNMCNAQMSSSQIKEYCRLTEVTQNLLTSAMKQMGLSARAYHRILKVSRTLADLDGVENIGEAHVAEAIGYRALDRKLWMP